MDYKRIALTAVVTWVVDSIFGTVVFMGLLGADMAQNPALFRPEAQMYGLLPLMFAGTLVAFFALAYIYAKGYEGGSGLVEGFRFGVLLAIFITGFMSIGIFATFNVGSGLAVKASIATIVEMLLDGTVMGLVYRGAPVRAVAHV